MIRNVDTNNNSSYTHIIVIMLSDDLMELFYTDITCLFVNVLFCGTCSGVNNMNSVRFYPLMVVTAVMLGI